MVYFVIVIVLVSLVDIKDLISQNKKRDLYVYVAIMLLVGAFGLFYYINPDRDSLSKILISLLGKGV